MNLNFKSAEISSRVVMLVAAVIAISLVWSTVKAVQKNYALQQDVDKLTEEISILELQNENLKLANEYYKTDTYLELEAREKFNKADDGENLLLLAKDGDGSEETANEENAVEDEKSNFEQWWLFLFGSSN